MSDKKKNKMRIDSDDEIEERDTPAMVLVTPADQPAPQPAPQPTTKPAPQPTPQTAPQTNATDPVKDNNNKRKREPSDSALPPPEQKRPRTTAEAKPAVDANKMEVIEKESNNSATTVTPKGEKEVQPPKPQGAEKKVAENVTKPVGKAAAAKAKNAPPTPNAQEKEGQTPKKEETPKTVTGKKEAQTAKKEETPKTEVTAKKEAQTPKKETPAKPLKKANSTPDVKKSSGTPKNTKEEQKRPVTRSSSAKATPTKKKNKSESESESESGSGSESESESGSESGSDESGSESGSEEESSSSSEKKTPKKKTTPKAKPKAKPTPKKKAKEEPPPKKKAKRGSKQEKEEPKRGRKKKEEDAVPIHKWWEEDDDWKKGEKKNWKWRTLEHQGVYFGPDYEPHGIPILYDGEKVKLTPAQEEWATYFARYLDTDHMKKDQFRKNFWKEWKAVLGKNTTIKSFKKVDFSLIKSHLDTAKEERKNRSKEEKNKEKEEKKALKEKYGFAIVDGHKEAIGNFTVEPPGLFLGRGQHPKAGMFKQRVTPEQITLNLGEGVDPPKCPIPGHKWGGIVHNHEVTWLATWRENINGQNKYVLFSAQSSMRGRSDRSKFETAKRLKKCIGKIRKDYTANLKNADDEVAQQRATAMWVIDRLALRVGNDKSEDEADTVGCCSLRCEHVKLLDDNKLEFDFLGKDSMRYHNVVEVDPQVYKNFKTFMSGKKKSEQIFDRLSPPSLNSHLQSLMDGLTAKVFRTYNASITMQKELSKFDEDEMTVEEKVLFFNRASVQVAKLCNHQRSVPKTHQTQMEKIDDQIKDTEDEIAEVKAHIKRLNAGKEAKKRAAGEDGKEKKPFSNNVETCKRKIEALEDRIRKLKIKKKEKDTLKEVSTSTSKVNYIDPRISLVWCQKHNVDIKKIFAKTMRDKFAWAIAEVEATPDFVF
eukprot:TRINITY_DN328_c0_g1_i4.p1 TRINITY_DN328_c0_g1~~TRINITY_DN328_c0_g1_i4.p1  ORF type:complete len:933 (+),score=218.51 TRINITY_DN328_c0_g1_i4:211-3009(+)